MSNATNTETTNNHGHLTQRAYVYFLWALYQTANAADSATLRQGWQRDEMAGTHCYAIGALLADVLGAKAWDEVCITGELPEEYR